MNVPYLPPQLYVGIDVGSEEHTVAMINEQGSIVREFSMPHTQKGFALFFDILEETARMYGTRIQIAMEGYNGWARPLDGMILEKGYPLFNVNNLKLARYKEVFPAAAKSDAIDARKIAELFMLQAHLPIARNVLQPIQPADSNHAILKILSRRHRQLTKEKIAIANRLGTQLNAQAPELKAATKQIDNLWFLRLLTLKKSLPELAQTRAKTIQKIPYLKVGDFEKIRQWQQQAYFGDTIAYIAPMIYEDAKRLLELKAQLAALKKQMQAHIERSSMALRIQSLIGFSTITAATLAGEIGTLDRFAGERSLAVYLGMANLDKSSGKYQGSKQSLSTNHHAKKVMIAAIMQHARHVEESKQYLQKKIAEGKKYQQAIRSIGRHLVRVLWSMITQERDYIVKEIKTEKND